MLLKNTIAAAICGSILISSPGFGQESPISRAEVSIEACAPLVESTNAQGPQQSAAVNYGFLGDYGFFFNKLSGVELSSGDMRNRQTYSVDSGSHGVKNNSDEVLAAYVFRFLAKRWSPFVHASASALIFDPTIVAGAGTQARLEYLYADGVDFTLRHQIPRTEHRGFFNSATFNVDGGNVPGGFSNAAEPSIVFGYSF
jgi:hypothetical protein